MNMTSKRALFASLFTVLTSALAFAQKPDANGASASDASSQPITLTRSVEPSFHIEPIVHRFHGNRGAVIPFEFEIASLGKAMDVEVVPIDLRQEESGVVLHREGQVTARELRIHSATTFKLAPGESQIIRGEVTVPLAKTNFLSYGILVKDRGQSGDKADTSNDGSQTTASIRFVTQYVLRVDIETGIQDIGEMNKLVLEEGRVESINGMPVVQTYLTNPTGFSLECYVRGTIESPTSSKLKPFNLNMPCRRDMTGDEKHLIRVMPNSRIRLEANVDSSMFPGDQVLKLKMTNGRRAISENDFPLKVKSGDFPALDVKMGFLDTGVSVQPAQVEVGHITGTSRSVNLKFSNNSDKAQSLQLVPVTFDGSPLAGIKLSSTAFEVKPGRDKTIRVVLDAARGKTESQFGYIKVLGNASPTPLHSLPVAMMFVAPNAPNVEVAELQRLEKDGYNTFQLQVTNRGSAFVPVNATVSIDDGKGRSALMADGYGRWLAPGETRMLRFDPKMKLGAGEQQVSLVVDTYPDADSIKRTLVIKIDETAESILTTSVAKQPKPAG
jgi:hypothetical protein